jgi:hypothetical protein
MPDVCKNHNQGCMKIVTTMKFMKAPPIGLTARLRRARAASGGRQIDDAAASVRELRGESLLIPILTRVSTRPACSASPA